MQAEAISGLANTSGHSLKSRLLVITVARRSQDTGALAGDSYPLRHATWPSA